MDGNNGVTFLTFIKSLRGWHINSRKTIYIMDNASYHNNVNIRKYIKEKGITVMYLPPSSSVLNPIELCWGIFKRRLGKSLA